MDRGNRVINIKGDKNRRINLLKFIIVFLILANLGGVANLFLPNNIIDIITVLFCVPFFVKGSYIFSKHLFGILLIVWFVVLCSSIVTGSSILEYKGIYLRTFISLIVLSIFKYDFGEIKSYFFKVGYVICILGLVNFLLTNIVPGWFVHKEIKDGYDVNTILYVFNWKSEMFFLKRNQGLYWEPGIFQFVLNLQLLLILFEKEYSVKKAILPIFLILTTGSTTGYLLMFLILSVKFLFVKSFKLGLFGKLLFFIILGSLYPIIQLNFEDKFKGESSQSAAFRTYDIIMGVQTIQSHPMVGIGMDKEKYINQSQSIDLREYYQYGGNVDSGRGNSNTILSVAFMFGIPLAVMFFYYLYKQPIFKSKKIFYCLLIVCLSSEPLFNNAFVMLFFLSGLYSRHVLKKKQYLTCSSQRA